MFTLRPLLPKKKSGNGEMKANAKPSGGTSQRTPSWGGKVTTCSKEGQGSTNAKAHHERAGNVQQLQTRTQPSVGPERLALRELQLNRPARHQAPQQHLAILPQSSQPRSDIENVEVSPLHEIAKKFQEKELEMMAARREIEAKASQLEELRKENESLLADQNLKVDEIRRLNEISGRMKQQTKNQETRLEQVSTQNERRQREVERLNDKLEEQIKKSQQQKLDFIQERKTFLEKVKAFVPGLVPSELKPETCTANAAAKQAPESKPLTSENECHPGTPHTPLNPSSNAPSDSSPENVGAESCAETSASCKKSEADGGSGEEAAWLEVMHGIIQKCPVCRKELAEYM